MKESKRITEWKRHVDRGELSALKATWADPDFQGGCLLEDGLGDWKKTLRYTLKHGNRDIASWCIDEKSLNLEAIDLLEGFIGAIKGNDPGKIKLFLSHCDPLMANEHGNTAFMYAVAYGLTDTVQGLLERGANVMQVNQKGESALFDAVYNREAGLFHRLCAVVPEGLRQRNALGETLLMVAAMRHDNLELLHALLPVSEINAINQDGDTALMAAVKHFNIDAIRVLMPVSDWSIQNQSGKDFLTLVDNVFRGRDPDFFNEVLNHGTMLKEKKELSEHIKPLESALPKKKL